MWPLDGIRRGQARCRITSVIAAAHHLIFGIDQDRGNIAHGDLNGPIGWIGVLLGIVKRSRNQIGNVRFLRPWRYWFREIHQFGNDLTEPVALVINKMRHCLVFRVR